MDAWTARQLARQAAADRLAAVTKALALGPGAPPTAVAVQPVSGNPVLASALAAAASNPPSPQTPPIIEQAMVAQGLDQADAFSPGRPLNPWAGYGVEPRGHDFKVGHNITARPRSGRISYGTLRNIINNYDVARICINHRIDDVRSLDWAVVAADGVETDVTDAVTLAKKAIAKPDGRTPFNGWLAMFLEDILRYDAGCLYRRRDMAGRPIGLEVVDGTTMAPELDYFGRRPEPPAPAFVQYIEGLPWDWMTSNDLVYHPFRPQPDSPYGLAPIEAVLLSANSDIRFQQFFLEYFTEGSIPGGFAEAPADQSNVGQIKEWQEVWDAVMEGDQAQKHKVKWVPAGTKFTPTRDNPFDDTFPLFLLHKTCAAFGVTPNDLGFTDDVNRSTGETQVDVQFRIGTLPLLRHLEGILTAYLTEDLMLPVKFQFETGQEKEDRETLVHTWQMGVFTGAVGVDEMRAEVFGLPVDNSRPIPRFILDSKTGPMPLRSLFAVAGAIDPSTLAPADDVPLDSTLFSGALGVMPMKAPGAADFTRAPIDPDDPGQPGSGVVVPGSDVVTPAASAAAANAAVATPVQAALNPAPDPEAAELRRWRDNARTRIRKGQTPRRFSSDVLSAATTDTIWELLADATTRDEVDHAFTVVIKAGLPKVPEYHSEPVAQKRAAVEDKVSAWAVAHLASALAGLHPGLIADLEALYASLSSRVVKAVGPLTPDQMADLEAAIAKYKGQPAPGLSKIVGAIYGNAWAAGAGITSDALADQGVTGSGGADLAVSGVDWSTWTPGWDAAAGQASNGGLADLLSKAEVTIQGMSDTQVDRIGTAVSAGLTNGDNWQTVATSINGVVNDPGRAATIAVTETSRAASAATMQSYSAGGIGQWNWLTAAGACDVCVDNEAGNPYDMGDGPDFPEHPNCRCTSTPVIEGLDDTAAPDDSGDEAGDDGSDAADGDSGE